MKNALIYSNKDNKMTYAGIQNIVQQLHLKLKWKTNLYHVQLKKGIC